MSPHSKDEQHFLHLANEAAEHSNCLRRKTGAILVLDGIPAVQGYNGTPINTLACNDGGCPRCASKIPELQGYENCACVHAEVNAVVLAARVGIRTQGASVFCTLRPCLGCLKVLIQAGIVQVVYCETYTLDAKIEKLWHSLVKQAGITLRQVNVQLPLKKKRRRHGI